jgi:hypothetical protein
VLLELGEETPRDGQCQCTELIMHFGDIAGFIRNNWLQWIGKAQVVMMTDKPTYEELEQRVRELEMT